MSDFLDTEEGMTVKEFAERLLARFPHDTEILISHPTHDHCMSLTCSAPDVYKGRAIKNGEIKEVHMFNKSLYDELSDDVREVIIIS